MTTVRLRRTRPEDLAAYVIPLERREDNRDYIGQWSEAEHLGAIAGEAGREHWIIERAGERAGYLIAYDTRATDGGIYVKRILVDEKEKGTGRAALVHFIDDAFARPGTAFVWLIVRDWNARAQKVYLDLGFRRYEPPEEEGRRLAEPPVAQSFRMRLDAAAWRARAIA